MKIGIWDIDRNRDRNWGRGTDRNRVGIWMRTGMG